MRISEDCFFDVEVEVVVPFFGDGGGSKDVREGEVWKDVDNCLPVIQELFTLHNERIIALPIEKEFNFVQFNKSNKYRYLIF